MIFPRVLDISYCQPKDAVHWAILKANGVQVVIRAGQYNFVDNLFAGHYANGLAAGCRPGIYLFNQPDVGHEVQIALLRIVWNSVQVKPQVLVYDCENISYWTDSTSDSVSTEIPVDNPVWSRAQVNKKMVLSAMTKAQAAGGGMIDGTGRVLINVVPPSKEFFTYHLWQWLVKAEKLSGLPPEQIGVYSREDYLKQWLIPSGTQFMFAGVLHTAPDWRCWFAWPATWTQYADSPIIFTGWDGWKLWQFEGGTGRIEGVDGPCDQNHFNGTQAECEAFFGAQSNGGTTMAATYVTTTPQAQRAKLLTLEGNQKLTVEPAQAGIDAVILPMGGMDRWDGNHMQHYVESTFAARCKQFAAVMPVLGMFRLDARYWGQEQYTAAQVENMSISDNFILGELLNAWHDGAWTMGNILSGKGKWNPLSALVLSMTETGWYAGAQADAGWQARTFLNVAERVKYLQDNGYAPKIPVILYTGPWWLVMYDKAGNDFQNKVLQSSTYQPWLSLLLGQWVRYSTSVFDNLGAIFAFPPDDTFKFEQKDDQGKVVYTYPDKYFERILGHEFTGDAQRCRTVTDAAGNAMSVKLSLWCDTKENMYKYLNFVPVVSPPPGGDPPPPPPATGDIKTVLEKLATIQTDLDAIKVELAKQATFRGWLETKLKGFGS